MTEIKGNCSSIFSLNFTINSIKGFSPMQKISSYLLKNRIQLVADLAAFTTEWTIVYQRQVKIYNGIDNTLEFDIKNADQKRICLAVINNGDVVEISNIELNVMDQEGYELPNSPYTLTPSDTIKGIATVTIPQEDLVDLEDQFLKFSVTALNNGNDIMLYGDTRFGATGTIELIGNAMPLIRDSKTYDDFYGVGDFNNTTITYTSSSINLKFKDAVPPTLAEIIVNVADLNGQIWIEATKDTVVGNESFTYKGIRLVEQTVVPADDTFTFSDIDIAQYTYLRVNYTKNPKVTVGAITNFTIEFYRP
jgi:hypothetical protein